MRFDFRMGTLIGIALAIVAALLSIAPIAQDPAYHRFADQRTVLGVANFWNVASNLPFTVLGVLGMSKVTWGCTPGYLPELKRVYWTFFAGVACTGLASAWYHANPGNHTLVWDRLALTAVFMSIFSLVWGEHLSITAGRKMALPLIVMGMASAVYWYITEVRGHGDLRFYVLIQLLPMVVLPLILAFYPSRLTGVGYIWGVLFCYTLSKVAEVLDGPLYRIFSGVSGHEIKHWVAALGIFIYYLAGLRRKRRFD